MHTCTHTWTHEHIHGHMRHLHIFLPIYIHAQEQTSTCAHTRVPCHLSTLVYAHTKYKYEYLGTLWLCMNAGHVYPHIHSSMHTGHMHMGLHMYIHVHVNTPSDFDLSPKPPYSTIAPSYPGELSISLTREWVTNAATELF